MHRFSADLPFPISVNNMFSQTRAGRRFPAPRYVAWRKQADIAVMLARRAAPVGHGPATVEIELRPPTKRRFDGDNLVKGVLDSLVRMNVLEDDDNKHVREIRTRWCDGEPGATVIVTWAQ